MKTPINLDNALSDIIALLRTFEEDQIVSVRNIIESFGHASFTPIMLVPALVLTSPLSGVPVLSTVCGLIIAITAAQMLARRSHIWLPAFLLDRKVSGPKLAAAVNTLSGVAAWIDERTKPRLRGMVRRPLVWLPQAICVLLGLAMPFLEFVPFTSSIAGIGVVFLSIGLLVRDGLFVLVGTLVAPIALMIPIFGLAQLAT